MGIVATKVDDVTIAPATDPLRASMLRHSWALGRMWTGLVAPSKAAWHEGATALGEAGAFPLSPELAADPTAIALAARLGATGGLAAAATTSADQARIYGELIGYCAGCHRRLGDLMD